MLVAITAVVLSLTGGAIAATIGSGDIKKNAVKSKHIKNGNGVKNKDIKDNTVKSSKIRNGTLLEEDFAPDALPGTGPKGDKGDKGDTGDTGPIGPSTGYGATTAGALAWNGAFQTVQSLTLPAGSYVLNGQVFANNNNAANAIVDCDLRIDGTPIDDGDDLVRMGNNNAPAERLHLVQSGAATFAAETTVTIACDTDVTPGSWSNRVLTAVKVGALG
jgi:hypothetical protein